MPNKRVLLNIFVAVILFLFVLSAIGLFNNPMGAQRNIYFAGLNDFFADFFNVLRYISEKDPYFNTINGYGEKPYLPLTYLILYPFSQLDNFGEMTLQQAWTSKIGIMSVFYFTAVSVFLLFLSLNQIRKRYDIPFYVFIGLLFSYVFVFSVERGNSIMLSAAFVSVYLFYYDSNDKNKRITAAVCLALAAVLKVYPVLLGFLYLEKRQYKDIFFSAVVALLLTFIPFAFFKGGFSNIPQLINNIKINSTNYDFARLYPRFSFPHLAYYAFNSVLLSNITYIFTIIISVFSICYSLLLKNKWMKITLLTLVLIYLPVNSALYCGLYLFPAIIFFFATLEDRSKGFNVFILTVFIILLNPFQFSISYKKINLGINYILANVALFSLWAVLFIASTRDVIISRFMAKKAPEKIK